MRIAISLLALLVLVALGTAVPPVMAMSTTEPLIPEFVITKPASEYCEFVVNLPPAPPEVAEGRLFDLMRAANAYTKGWRTSFAIVGVNYVSNTAFNLISFSSCPAAATALDFVAQFVEKWQKLHCEGRCQLSKPRFTSRPKLDFAIPYGQYAFKSQIDEFLHYHHQRDALSRCTIEIELAPLVGENFAHTELFGAVMELQRKYRFPIMDISQIDQMLYILLSRQCPDKQALYARMLWNLNHEGVSHHAFRAVNFHPNVSDYLFSQTGHR